MYDGSVEYVIGIVTPITNWVDLELLPPVEYYVDHYLPELDPDQQISKGLIQNFDLNIVFLCKTYNQQIKRRLKYVPTNMFKYYSFL